MKKKILLVEYATSAIDTIKEILYHPIFEIRVASEGDAAKEYLARQPFDMMITAAMLPKFHGFNLSQYAAENYSDMKIIIISEIYKGMDYKHQATTIYRAHDFFEKPLEKEVFKKRVFELLNITPEVLDAQSRLTTTQVPVPDTRKIPTLKKLKEEGKKLSSEDLFGDIIEKVQEIPSYEIKLDKTGDIPARKSKTPVADKRKAPPEEAPVTQELKSPEVIKTQKIDMELLDLIRSGRKEGGKKDRKLKRIEDDISKRLEDTLSGLGVSEKKPSPVENEVKPKPEHKPPPAPEVPVMKTKKVETKEKADEVSGYEILGLIGRGGMAEIYKAKKKGVKGFEKIIALKKILSGYGADAKYIEMFVDEAKIAAELSHPNIIHIYDLGKKDDYYFIAMEYVSGKDLRVILQKLTDVGRKMPVELAISLVIKVLAALHYAHTARDSSGKNLDIVHRDVSPPNILVSYDGNVKLTDFGVSKASIKMHQTIAGALKGKLLYMSPEQAKGEDNIDFRSDLYSVGIILYELITGEKLFLGSSEISTLKKVQEGQVVKPSEIQADLDPELEAIILKALENDKNKRYQKASDMIKDLDAYLIKNYDGVPESAHIAHFICTLFEEEIVKEGIEVNLNPPGYEVTKKSKPETREIKKGAPKEEIFELPEEAQLEESLTGQEDTAAERELEEDLIKQEEFQPIIEIRFDDDKVKSKPEEKPSRPDYGAFPLQHQEGKKKKTLLIAAVVAIAVLAAAVIIYLSLGSGESPAGDQPGPVSAAGSEAQPKTADEGSADTEVLTSQPEVKPADQQESPPLAVDTSAETESSAKKKKTKPEERKKTGAGMVQEKKEPAPARQEEIPPPQLKKKEEKTGEKELESQEQAAPPEKKKTEVEIPAEEKKPEAKPEEAKPEETKESTPPPTEQPVPPAEDQQKMPPQEKKQVEQVQRPVVKEGDILSPSQLDSQPIPVSTPGIKITHSIQRLLMSDQRILVSYLVDHNGNVETVKILSQSTMKKLNTLIIETIKKWKYKPATKNNIKVKVWKNQWIAIKK